LQRDPRHAALDRQEHRSCQNVPLDCSLRGQYH
jgi:hypothetical protein